MRKFKIGKSNDVVSSSNDSQAKISHKTVEAFMPMQLGHVKRIISLLLILLFFILVFPFHCACNSVNV